MRAIKAYDILQVRDGSAWLDYVTLRDDIEIDAAVRRVNDNDDRYRIVSGNMPGVGEVLLK